MRNRNSHMDVSMTNCAKSGIKIRQSDNDYKHNPFAKVESYRQQVNDSDFLHLSKGVPQYETLDLNINNYSREDLYKLFGFKSSIILSDDNMKEAKKVVLKTHPDKSRLDNKYFVFFSAAYKKLKEIYEFQNKTSNKTIEQYEFERENEEILDKFFDAKKDLKKGENFNKWFIEQFDKHRLEDPLERGYGDWLKSDEDIVYMPQNISKDTMSREMDKRKREIQSLTPYKGYGDMVMSSSVGGSALMEYDSNFSSGSVFGGDVGYTDLRQAYTESVIPITEDDFNKVRQYKSIDEYKRYRDSMNVEPSSQEESIRKLYQQDRAKNEESATLAFHYAKQSEKVKQNNEKFWSSLKQLTNW